MLIFNAKGIVVALATFIVLALVIWMGLSAGVSVILAGITALFVSVKMSKGYTGFFALPSIFIIPTHVYAGIIIIIGIAIFIKEPVFLEKKAPQDIRKQLVERDIALLDSQYVNTDPVANDLKEYVSSIVIKQMKPGEIKYLVKENTDSSKILVLVKFPQIKELRKEMRSDFIQIIHKYFKMDAANAGKKIYIGIADNSSLAITDTPENGIESSFLLANSGQLLPFYGNENPEKY